MSKQKKDLAKRTVKTIRKEVLPTARELALIQNAAPIELHVAAISMGTLFAIFPFALLVASIVSFVGASPEVINTTLTSLEGVLPERLMALIEAQIIPLINDPSAGVFSIAFILLIWAVSKVIRRTISSLDQIYRNTKKRKWYMRYMLSLVFAIVFGASFFLFSNLLVWGGAFAHWLSGMIELSGIFQVLFLQIHWPILALLMAVIFVLMYRFLPNHDPSPHPLLSHVPGAILATAAWIIASLVFSLYIGKFASFEIYGTIGTFIVLILYINVTTYAFLGGAYLNSAREQRIDSKTFLRQSIDLFRSGIERVL